MTANELREKIRVLAKQVYKDVIKADDAALAYPEIQKFPPLKDIIVNLLTNEFDSFIESVDWVAPRPTTFRVNLLNGENFLLMYTIKSWIGTVEGKKYYLLNLDEEERCALGGLAFSYDAIHGRQGEAQPPTVVDSNSPIPGT